MGINFASMSAGAVTPAPAPTAPGVTLDLNKNTLLDITKRNPGLKHLTVGAGWDVSRSQSAIDIDILAFALNSNGKINSGADVIFFNNMTIPGVHLNGDNTTGDGEGDDETMDIDLSAISPNVNEIVFCVAIYDAVNRRQTFGMVNNSYVRLMDKDQGDKELCHFILKDDYSTDTAVVFASLVRNGSDWDFVTLGEGKQADINGLVALYS